MKKFKEIILYLIFGVLTTVVNFIFFSIFNKFTDPLISNIIAWIFAVSFAFVTNKLLVFESKSWSKKTVIKEGSEFFGARLFSLGIEEAGLALMLKVFHLDIPLEEITKRFLIIIDNNLINLPEKFVNFFTGEMIVKIILSVVVIVLNYIFSKLIIFKKDN